MANRKLQGEIERCLKKVGEGIEEFSELYDKIYSTTNQSQKEKLEAELKREIKKLQRLRDQIKTWISSSEIKDKRPLTEARKNIETQMERFKACEREMKTKQYSKEGLQAKEKLDPAEVARNESAQWITGQVDKLNTQVDALEAESEQIHASKGRKVSKADANRLKKIDQALERHKFHMVQLETMLRMLENDQLTVDDVESVKESVEYYVDSNQDPDFEEDEEMYDHLNLIDEDIGILDDHHGSSESIDKAPVEEEKKKIESVAETTTSPTKKSSKSTPTPVKAKSPTLPVKQVPPLPSAPVAKVPPPPVQKYSVAAAAAAVAPQATTKSKMEDAKKVSVGVVESSVPSASASPALDRPETSFSSIVQSNKSPPIQPQQLMQLSDNNTTNTNTVDNFEDAVFPESFINLISTFNQWQKRTYGYGDEVLRNQYLLALLDSSYQQCPDIIDSEQPEAFVPQNPSRTIPPYYPKQPMIALSSPAIFERFDIDTLFFLFYYRQNTKEQVLAARELKRQSWRFHKKYLTWFQRHEEPKTITDEYEQGTYIYFDYEGAWCQRKKTEFTFEYRYLEGE